jgi:hypothetical protein
VSGLQLGNYNTNCISANLALKELFELIGAPEEIRTPGLMIRSIILFSVWKRSSVRTRVIRYQEGQTLNDEGGKSLPRNDST